MPKYFSPPNPTQLIASGLTLSAPNRKRDKNTSMARTLGAFDVAGQRRPMYGTTNGKIYGGSQVINTRG